MDKIVNIQNIDPTTLELQTYSSDDQNLISSFDVENSFSSSIDYVEYTVYDFNQNLLLYIDNFRNYSILNNNLQIDPEADLTLYGFNEGQYITNYNFLKNILGSSNNNKYYISEISSDRTELRLDTNSIPNDIVINETNTYKIELEQTNYYKDFNLNFGDNQLIIANNVLLDNSDPNNPTVLIKLYEPLPSQFDLKSELWVVETITDPIAYQIDITLIFNNVDSNIQLRGPNLNISSKDRINNSTEYTNFNLVKNTSSQYGSGSLKYQLNSLLIEKGIEINIDYNDYYNFVFLSSAKTRLENFYYKVSLIEEYTINSQLSTTGSSSGSYYVSSSFDIYQAKINDIITTFDGYEYFLYFESGSKSWPKTNDTVPYINAYSTSSLVQNWLTEQYNSASYYDTDLNPNNLINSIPSYLKDDPTNSQYQLFVEMIGQHFDSIWVYIKDITNKYNADNRIDYGVSKDLVAEILRDLGVKIYQNNFSTNDLYTSFLGLNPQGGITTPTGSELITNFIQVIPDAVPYVNPGYMVTGYTGNQPVIVPLDDVNKSIYKRIYHNLPYLFKKKGTVEGLRALITLYGIPDTILRIDEFGGKNKDNVNDWDQWQNIYNYAFYTSGSNYITSSFIINTSWNAINSAPGAVAFRFKTDGIPTIPSQSLWGNNSAALVLKYTGSGYTTSSYNGGPIDPYYQYGTLTFYPNINNLNASASVYLPFFDKGWWSVLINSGSSGYELIVKNKLYDGNDGNQIGFQASSSKSTTATWYEPTSYLGISSLAPIFTGSLQELRFYTKALSQEDFDEYVVNPSSIEASETLAFRAPLGGDLYIGTASIHPKITGSWITTSSFASNSSFYFANSPIFYSNVESVFLNQFPAGIKNVVNNKIKLADTIIPSGDTLSPYIRIQQDLPVSGSYTRDLNLLEVALSPQNEIDDDIINQLGFFNLGEYIGDPRQLDSTNTFYPDLNTLRNNYFKKYKSNYNLNDYIRLIKFFDNSLFKMIKDFVPARTSLSSGIVIKQHLLERNRYRVPSASYSEPYYTASVKSFPFDFTSSQLYKSTGGSAGSMPNVTQSWSSSYMSPLGPVNTIHNDDSEFYTGQLSGSTIIVTTQSLAVPTSSLDPILNNVDIYPLSQYFLDVDYSSGQAIPTNQNLLISGTATHAPVKDYYYNLQRQVIPRYKGSRLFGSQINEYNTGDTSYGKEPVINNYQTYFLTFKEIRGAYPELVGKSTLFINSLVDQNGNQLVVDKIGSTYYYNLIDNFGKDSTVNLQVTTLPTGSNITHTEQSTTIFRPALLWPKVILTNESGSYLNYLGIGKYTATSSFMNISDGTSTYIPSQIFTASISSGQERTLTASFTLFQTWYTSSFTTQSVTQDTSLLGGYDPATTFNLKVGQEIRFNQDESQVFVITNIETPSLGSPPLIITLDKDMSVELRNEMILGVSPYFLGILIREYTEDPSKLVINAPKLVGGASGYLTPKYMSPDLIASLDKIVTNLKGNGVL